MQNIHDRQTRINANEIRQLQRAHGYIRPVLHDIIDIFFCSYAGLETNDRFVDIRHQDPVGKKARRVRGLGWYFPHFLHKGQSGGDCGLGGLETGDYLDALLDGDGVHEMGAYYTGGGGEVG